MEIFVLLHNFAILDFLLGLYLLELDLLVLYYLGLHLLVCFHSGCFFLENLLFERFLFEEYQCVGLFDKLVVEFTDELAVNNYEMFEFVVDDVGFLV